MQTISSLFALDCHAASINHTTAERQLVYSLLPLFQPIESCLCS